MLRGLLLAVFLVFLAPALALGAEEGWHLLRRPSTIVLFRHATAPGTGDPAGFRLDDCRTQRNLDRQGRAEARAIGEAFRARGISVSKVLASQWCRSWETAELAFPGQVTAEPAFNSFFGNPAAEPGQTAAAQAILSAWKEPGVLVVVSHQVNIAALTGFAPRPGEGIVLGSGMGRLRVLGWLPPPVVSP
jgi:phosphohistidine phosphatase SixA